MTAKKQVATKETSAPATTEAPSILGAVDPKDLLLPRIELGQAMSPSVQDGKNKPGDIYNNMTNQVFEAPVHVIPLKNEKNFIRWAPRQEGGGIVYRTDDPQDPRVLEDTKWGADGSKPVCTAYLNFLCLVRGEDMPIVLSFHDTGYQAGRKLLTMMAMAGGKVRSYVLSSKSKTNNYGTFFVYDVGHGDLIEGPELANAMDIHNNFAGSKLNFSEDRADSSGGAAPIDEVEEF